MVSQCDTMANPILNITFHNPEILLKIFSYAPITHGLIPDRGSVLSQPFAVNLKGMVAKRLKTFYVPTPIEQNEVQYLAFQSSKSLLTSFMLGSSSKNSSVRLSRTNPYFPHTKASQSRFHRPSTSL